MAYTGTDEDGGIGYVTTTEPDLKAYLKRKVVGTVRRVRSALEGVFGR